jgi:hypothetical protein
LPVRASRPELPTICRQGNEEFPYEKKAFLYGISAGAFLAPCLRAMQNLKQFDDVNRKANLVYIHTAVINGLQPTLIYKFMIF